MIHLSGGSQPPWENPDRRTIRGTRAIGGRAAKHGSLIYLHRVDTKLQPILVELRRRLEEIYGDRLVKMILYGSQARGDAEAGSDVDVLVVLKGMVRPAEEIERTGGIVAELSLQHEIVISTFFMDEDRFRHRQGPLLRNVRREGVEI